MRGSRGESESCADPESCADLEGSQKEEGSGNLQENQSSSVYIVNLLNICIGPPFPRPWKTFLDLCMEAISLTSEDVNTYILSRFFFRAAPERSDRKVGIYMYTFNSFEKTICSSVNNMIYKCMVLLYPSDLLV